MMGVEVGMGVDVGVAVGVGVEVNVCVGPGVAVGRGVEVGVLVWMTGHVAVEVGDMVSTATSGSGGGSLFPNPSTPVATKTTDPAITNNSTMNFQIGQRRFSTILPQSCARDYVNYIFGDL
jgi:hypothetical protein